MRKNYKTHFMCGVYLNFLMLFFVSKSMSAGFFISAEQCMLAPQVTMSGSTVQEYFVQQVNTVVHSDFPFFSTSMNTNYILERVQREVKNQDARHFAEALLNNDEAKAKSMLVELRKYNPFIEMQWVLPLPMGSTTLKLGEELIKDLGTSSELFRELVSVFVATDELIEKYPVLKSIARIAFIDHSSRRAIYFYSSEGVNVKGVRRHWIQVKGVGRTNFERRDQEKSSAETVIFNWIGFNGYQQIQKSIGLTSLDSTSRQFAGIQSLSSSGVGKIDFSPVLAVMMIDKWLDAGGQLHTIYENAPDFIAGMNVILHTSPQMRMDELLELQHYPVTTVFQEVTGISSVRETKKYKREGLKFIKDFADDLSVVVAFFANRDKIHGQISLQNMTRGSLTDFDNTGSIIQQREKLAKDIWDLSVQDSPDKFFQSANRFNPRSQFKQRSGVFYYSRVYFGSLDEKEQIDTLTAGILFGDFNMAYRTIKEMIENLLPEEDMSTNDYHGYARLYPGVFARFFYKYYNSLDAQHRLIVDYSVIDAVLYAFDKIKGNTEEDISDRLYLIGPELGYNPQIIEKIFTRHGYAKYFSNAWDKNFDYTKAIEMHRKKWQKARLSWNRNEAITAKLSFLSNFSELPVMSESATADMLFMRSI